MQTFNDNVNIIQALDDLPNAVGGLTADQLKAKFDEAANLIKTYINEVLIPALTSTTASSSGASQIGIEEIVGLTGFHNVQDALAGLKAAVDAATTGTIPDGSLTTAKLADRAVTTDKLANEAVTWAKIAPNQVTNSRCDFSTGLTVGNLTCNGTILLSANDYGDNLPATATAGRLFFKRVQ